MISPRALSQFSDLKAEHPEGYVMTLADVLVQAEVLGLIIMHSGSIAHLPDRTIAATTQLFTALKEVAETSIQTYIQEHGGLN